MAIFLIVISHITMDLSVEKPIINNGYLLDLSHSTTDIQQFILTLFRYLGSTGNWIFFICSAWFLTDLQRMNYKKLFFMVVEVWLISVLFLAIAIAIIPGGVPVKEIFGAIMPTTFGNNWYITCYLMICVLCPYLNEVILRKKKKELLSIVVVLISIYIFLDFLMPGLLYSNDMMSFITVYFAVAYMKKYLMLYNSNVKLNVLILFASAIANILLVLITNIMGLRRSFFSTWLLRWYNRGNPFLILFAVSAFNIAKEKSFYNETVNRISGLSLLVYIIHENFFVRSYFRPRLWFYIYEFFGYDYVVLWDIILSVLVFCLALTASFVVKKIFNKAVAPICDDCYPMIKRAFLKIIDRLAGIKV